MAFQIPHSSWGAGPYAEVPWWMKHSCSILNFRSPIMFKPVRGSKLNYYIHASFALKTTQEEKFWEVDIGRPGLGSSEHKE